MFSQHISLLNELEYTIFVFVWEPAIERLPGVLELADSRHQHRALP